VLTELYSTGKKVGQFEKFRDRILDLTLYFSKSSICAHYFDGWIRLI